MPNEMTRIHAFFIQIPPHFLSSAAFLFFLYFKSKKQF
ncbi:hypothetical protein BAXH7_03541 [Bacillus amyloliquefaciens XH7]|nr:hypothetical protein LL3_03552 [Bacillus amyloliquefaciens LL3]AEK90653.1 hypothetical protein BAXH7_03541 [Bacillus amyloliquefaciens XH7]KYC99188.1 hypothetical protein B425_3661 [Bacillus amyloliquefaciens]QBG57883.1 hypothetical protein D2M30_3583 [Bacillus amyloliquefaciens]